MTQLIIMNALCFAIVFVLLASVLVWQRTIVAEIKSLSNDTRHLEVEINELNSKVEISAKLSERIELQEKLIGELKKTQVDPEVTDTMTIISEWMNGGEE